MRLTPENIESQYNQSEIRLAKRLYANDPHSRPEVLRWKHLHPVSKNTWLETARFLIAHASDLVLTPTQKARVIAALKKTATKNTSGIDKRIAASLRSIKEQETS